MNVCTPEEAARLPGSKHIASRTAAEAPAADKPLMLLEYIVSVMN